MIRLVPDRPPAEGPSECADCGAPIVWALTDADRRLPVDVEPREGGRLELFSEIFPDGEPVEPGIHRVRARPEDRPPTSPAWWPHWATCSARPRRARAWAILREQLRRLVDRKWGPLFASRTGGGR